MPYVYLLQEIDTDNINPTGFYKIGQTSVDVEKRKQQYRAGNARRVDTLHTIEVHNAQAVETELHRQLATARCQYGGGDEWFDFRDIDIGKVIAFMNNYDETLVYESSAYSDEYFSEASSDTYNHDDSYDHNYENKDWLENFSGMGAALLIFLGILFGGFLISQSPQDTSAHIQVPTVTGYDVANLRSSPSFGDEFVIGYIRNGEKVKAYEISPDGKWRRIRSSDGRTGWVANNFVK